VRGSSVRWSPHSVSRRDLEPRAAAGRGRQAIADGQALPLGVDPLGARDAAVVEAVLAVVLSDVAPPPCGVLPQERLTGTSVPQPTCCALAVPSLIPRALRVGRSLATSLHRPAGKPIILAVATARSSGRSLVSRRSIETRGAARAVRPVFRVPRAAEGGRRGSHAGAPKRA
jgi:hypothetical protein